MFFVLFCGVGGLGLPATAFWIWMIIDCVKYESSTGNDKVVWLLLLIFTHGIGATIYYFARKRPRDQGAAKLRPLPRK